MIRRLRVKDLGPLKEATLDDRAPVQILLGPNEAGKSYLLEALHVLYFGTRGGLAVGDNKALTRDGAKGWKIEATLGDDELEATRSKRPLQEACEKAMGDPRVFRALTYLHTFIDAKPAERKALLADLQATDTSALLAQLGELEARPEILKLVAEGNVKRAHNLALEDRRSKGRELRAVTEYAALEIEDPELETKQGTLKVSQLPLDTIEASLKRLRSRRDKALKAKTLRGTYEATRAAAATAREDLEKLSAEAAWADGDERRLAEVVRELDQQRRLASDATAAIASASNQGEALKKLIESGAAACPTCNRELDAESAQEALREVERASAGIIIDAENAQRDSAEAQERLSTERVSLVKRKETVAQAKTYRTRLQDTIARAEELEEPGEADAVEANHEDEILRVSKMRDARLRFEEATRMKESASDRIDGIQKVVDHLSQIEALCDPTVMADEEEVLERLNGLLERTAGAMGVLVEISTGYELMVQRRHPGLAADSALVRAGFGVACSLAAIAGKGLALLDRFESLDDANRKKALGVVKGLVDEGLLSTVWIAAVKAEPKRGADVPWLAWVKVDDGTAVYL